MKTRGKIIMNSLCILLCVTACAGPQWEPLNDEEFARHGEELTANLEGYVSAQEAYFAEHESYAAHTQIDYPPNVRLAARPDTKSDGFSN